MEENLGLIIWVVIAAIAFVVKQTKKRQLAPSRSPAEPMRAPSPGTNAPRQTTVKGGLFGDLRATLEQMLEIETMPEPVRVELPVEPPPVAPKQPVEKYQSRWGANVKAQLSENQDKSIPMDLELDDPDQLARGIVLCEILGKPLALRGS